MHYPFIMNLLLRTVSVLTKFLPLLYNYLKYMK